MSVANAVGVEEDQDDQANGGYAYLMENDFFEKLGLIRTHFSEINVRNNLPSEIPMTKE